MAAQPAQDVPAWLLEYEFYDDMVKAFTEQAEQKKKEEEDRLRDRQRVDSDPVWQARSELLRSAAEDLLCSYNDICVNCYATILRVKWKCDRADDTNGGYNEPHVLRELFTKYGELRGVGVARYRNGSAVVEFKTVSSAMEALRERGKYPHHFTVSVFKTRRTYFTLDIENPHRDLCLRLWSALHSEKQKLRKIEYDRLRKLEEARVKKLEEERLGKLEEERLKAIEEERLKKLEEERMRILEEERIKKMEIEHLDKLEKELLHWLQGERLKKLEKERIRKLENERLKKLEEERLIQLENERLIKLEEDRLEKIEQERLKKLEQERLYRADKELLKKLEILRLRLMKRRDFYMINALEDENFEVSWHVCDDNEQPAVVEEISEKEQVDNIVDGNSYEKEKEVWYQTNYIELDGNNYEKKYVEEEEEKEVCHDAYDDIDEEIYDYVEDEYDDPYFLQLVRA